MLTSVISTVALAIATSVTATATTGTTVTDHCVDCHGSAERMKELGFPHFTVTQAEVEAQSGMSASCVDCHLGDGESPDKVEAHRGMGRLILVEKRGLKGNTAERKQPLEINEGVIPTIRYQVEKAGKIVTDSSVKAILYQDKRPDTLSQDYGLMNKTCGKCHPKELAEFRQSNMGHNGKQSLYKTWADKGHGPHNCGVWFADNYQSIAAATSVPFAKEESDLNQRSCNTCHVACLDCHYFPAITDKHDMRKGLHTFNRRPEPASCYGGGRGTLCHAGPEERRRGAGYFGGRFSFPEGMESDVHLAAGVGCLDCHDNSGGNEKLGHGTIKRQATCDGCHGEIVTSHASSLHKSLSCEACHIVNVAGYQATFWGPGELAGSNTPFYKYNGYYGIMKEPILIRDQRGRWVPVKPYPMAVLNQKTADLKPGLHWRYPPGLPELERTDDAWGFVGLFNGLPENNRALLWIQMDKLSHKYGRSRSCQSCHGDGGGVQRQEVKWEFSDQGAFPFNGSHTVTADRNGLRISAMKAEGKIDINEGYRLSSFAPWVYLRDKWRIEGNFALPVVKERKRFDMLQSDPVAAAKAGLMHGH